MVRPDVRHISRLNWIDGLVRLAVSVDRNNRIFKSMAEMVVNNNNNNFFKTPLMWNCNRIKENWRRGVQVIFFLLLLFFFSRSSNNNNKKWTQLEKWKPVRTGFFNNRNDMNFNRSYQAMVNEFITTAFHEQNFAYITIGTQRTYFCEFSVSCSCKKLGQIIIIKLQFESQRSMESLLSHDALPVLETSKNRWSLAIFIRFTVWMKRADFCEYSISCSCKKSGLIVTVWLQIETERSIKLLL